MSRNSITPSRAFFTTGVFVLTTGASPLGPGRQSRTAHAQEATGFGAPFSSTRHMRQLPAIDSRSWKQKRGISAPAASHAWSRVYSGGMSTSMPSTMSLVISTLSRPAGKGENPQADDVHGCNRRHARPPARVAEPAQDFGRRDH